MERNSTFPVTGGTRSGVTSGHVRHAVRQRRHGDDCVLVTSCKFAPDARHPRLFDRNTRHTVPRSNRRGGGSAMTARTASLLLALLLPAATEASAVEGRFLPTGAMHEARSGHTATLLPDGRVLIAGGWSESSAPRDSAELYDPQSGTFASAGRLHAPRSVHSATLLADGRVLIAGGYGPGAVAQSSTELFDPAT